MEVGMVSEQGPLLELRHIVKRYPGVVALDKVSLTIEAGQIHVLLGENGAGKSTLIKTIVGVETADEGEMFWNGSVVSPKSIQDAYNLGIAVIYQELSTIPCLSIAENFFIGNELAISGIPFTVNWRAQYERAREGLLSVGLDIDPRTPMERLGMGQKQLCEVAKALDRKARFIIMDEPTSSLSRKEIDNLLSIMKRLKRENVSVLFITHKLEEAKKVGDVVTILKDGRKTGDTLPIGCVSEDEIIHMMVGRKLSEKFPKRESSIGEEILKVSNLTSQWFKNISFSVRKGELLGIFGLIGARRTELMRAIFGADEYISGEMEINGKVFRPKSPKDAIDNGITLLTENRKEEGLALIHDVAENVTLPSLKQFLNKFFLLRNKARYTRARELSEFLNLRPLDLRRLALNFSGGNQQKIVLGKWLNTGSKLIIFDEPTKGVDVGAKVEIYNIMNTLLRQGTAIIMVSSELPEILGMSDRIITMYEGAITGQFMNDQTASQEGILTLATGGSI
jgi:ribose transport system ATP-binding protein